LTTWAYGIFRFFRRLGPFGIMTLSALDSSILVLPFGNDLLLIALLTSRKPGPSWIVLVVMCAAGSIIGTFVDDLLTRKAGEKGLEKFVNPKQVVKLKARIEKHAGWVVFTTTLLPPPFPYTPVIMTAAALQYPRRNLLLVAFAGRMLRFSLIAMLALYFGKQLLSYARHSTALEYIVYAIIGIAIVGTTLTLMKWFKK
jgi:membrane protein YqaA with SNARE-associated domain